MATTENTDDTILDDELDENEFTFDNENEDALLAETEYDFVEATEKGTCNDLESGDHLETEEDVLDIGIAEEDIVETESTAPTQSASASMIIPSSTSNAFCESQFATEENEQSSSGGNIQKDELDATVKDCEYLEMRPVTTNDSVEFHEKECISSAVDEIKTNESVSPSKSDTGLEKCVKSTVISLKKSVGKNYDNLPALAKMIEKVQPTVSSPPTLQPFRNRKLHNKEHDNDYRDNGRKRGESATYKRRYDHDDSRRRIERRRYTPSMSDNSSNHHNGDSSRHLVQLDNPKWISHSEDSVSQKYEEYALESTLESNMTRQVIDERTRYENTSTGFAHQSIVASVQITQERYHITSDLSLPVSDGSFNRSFCDFGTSTAVSLPPPPGIRHIGPPQPQPQPLLHPPRTAGPPFMGNNTFMRPPLGPPGIRNSTAVPFFRSMPPPLPRLTQPPLTSSVLNRPPLNMGGAPLIYPNHNPNFPSPHPQLPFSGPSHQVRSVPPPSPSQPMNGPLFPPPAPNNPHHPHFQPASMTPPAAHQPPPTSFGSPQMVPIRCPPPFRQLVPAQQLQGPPRLAPAYAPRMSLPPSTRIPFANSNATTSHPATFPSHGANSTALGAPNMPSPGYQQPPPPGVHSSLHLPPPPFYQSVVNETNFSQYESNNQHVRPLQPKQPQQVQQQNRSFYADPEQISCGMSDYLVVQKEANVNNLKRANVDSTDEGGGYKQTRYDYSPASPVSKRDEDEEMMLYREKVEHQKKLREKFVQMKEEQRLKNQMQSFIQNNIKGILEKREQFLRKSEDEFRGKSESGSRAGNSHGVDGGSCVGHARSVEDAAYRRGADRSARPEKVAERGDKSSTSLKRVAQSKCKPAAVAATTSSSAESEAAEKTRRQSSSSSSEVAATALTSRVACSEQRQLHKVIKIKYKDGTVAFKSIPVHSSDGDSVATKHDSNIRGGGGGGGGSSGGGSDAGKSLLLSAEEDADRRGGVFGSSGAAHRRMVVAKRIPIASVKNDTSNENAIVESIRKGVTQSSVPLAQRFANLRATNKPPNARPL